MKRFRSVMILFTVLFLMGAVDIFPTDSHVEQLPVMTSNTTPTGTASASSVYSSSYEAWRALDGDDESGSRSRWISAATTDYIDPQWISYSFSSGRPSYISHYYILPDYYDATTRSEAPKDWELQGWNGTSWDTLDSRSNMSIDVDWDYRGLYFKIANPRGYQTYRLYITQVNGAEVVSIRKFKLIEPKDLVPLMTSNTTPLGTAAASGILGTGYEAWRAFDGDDDGGFWSRWISANISVPQWLSYDFGTAKTITHYYILPEYASSTKNRSPRDWELQGWDGSAWVTIDSRVSMRLDIEWNFGGLYLEVASPGPYSQYRLYVTAVNGSTVVSIRMLKLYSN